MMRSAASCGATGRFSKALRLRPRINPPKAFDEPEAIRERPQKGTKDTKDFCEFCASLWLIPLAGLGKSELWNNVAAVNLKGFFFVAAHQINIELRHAQRLQFLKLPDVLGDLENHAVADASCAAQGFGSVAGDPYRRNA